MNVPLPANPPPPLHVHNWSFDPIRRLGVCACGETYDIIAQLEREGIKVAHMAMWPGDREITQTPRPMGATEEGE